MPDLLKRRLDRPLFLTGLIQSLLSPEGYPSPLRSLDLGLIVIYLITVSVSREPFRNRRGPPRNHDLGSRRLTRRFGSFTLLSTSFIAEGGTRRHFASDVPVILDTGDPVAANRSPTLDRKTRKACCLSMRMELPASLAPASTVGTCIMRFVSNVAGNARARLGAATVRERLAARTRLIRQCHAPPFSLRLVRVRG